MFFFLSFSIIIVGTVGETMIGKKGITYKDMDWMSFGHRICIRNQNTILKQLTLDSMFLEKCNVMDYSFLLGIKRIHSTNNYIDDDDDDINKKKFWLTNFFRQESTTRKRRYHHRYHGGVRSNCRDDDCIYYMGIIDILQKWNTRKKAEMTVKRVRHFSLVVEPSFSCVAPKTYRNRFINFLESGVFRNNSTAGNASSGGTSSSHKNAI